MHTCAPVRAQVCIVPYAYSMILQFDKDSWDKGFAKRNVVSTNITKINDIGTDFN